MRMYEFEGKKLFAQFGIPIPAGKIANSAADAEKIVGEMGTAAVLKSQVLTGGRGKAGGIKIVDSPGMAKTVAEELFQLKIKSFPVEKLLIEPKLDIKKEFYLGVTIDRAKYQLVIIGSSEGGVDIEEIAAKAPDKIIKHPINIDEPLYGFDAIAIAKQMGFEGTGIKAAQRIITSLLKLFRAYDAKLAEINPLVELADGTLIAADSRISLDDDALFRHPELKEMGVEKRHEEGEQTPRERQATDWGIPYLDLDGNIGMFPGGAGFGIMGNDFIHYYGGKPANFMDSGGGPSPES